MALNGGGADLCEQVGLERGAVVPEIPIQVPTPDAGQAIEFVSLSLKKSGWRATEADSIGRRWYEAQTQNQTTVRRDRRHVQDPRPATWISSAAQAHQDAHRRRPDSGSAGRQP